MLRHGQVEWFFFSNEIKSQDRTVPSSCCFNYRLNQFDWTIISDFNWFSKSKVGLFFRGLLKKKLVKSDDKKILMSGSLSMYRCSYLYKKFISFHSSYLLSFQAVPKLTEYTSMATWPMCGTSAPFFYLCLQSKIISLIF